MNYLDIKEGHYYYVEHLDWKGVSKCFKIEPSNKDYNKAFHFIDVYAISKINGIGKWFIDSKQTHYAKFRDLGTEFDIKDYPELLL